MSTPVSWLDDASPAARIRELIDEGCSNRDIAAKIAEQFEWPTSEASIRRFRIRHGIEDDPEQPESVEINGDEAVTTSPSTSEPPNFTNEEDLFKEYGLNSDEWEIRGSRISKWGGPDSPRYQMRLNLTRTTPSTPLMYPRTDGWVAPPKQKIEREGGELVVIVGDQQWPFADPDLHKAFITWLEINKPNRGVSLGDSVDLPDISRHPADPENNAVVNECLQTGYDGFRGYVEASPDTEWEKLLGNHDDRIRNYLLKNAPLLYGVKRPTDVDGGGGEVLHSLSHAMRLDELGIDVVESGGDYRLGQIKLSKHLAVRHGWIARTGSGATALATLQNLRYSIVVGHTHRQSIVHDTKASIDGEVNTITGAEAGCMCRVSQTRGVDGRIFPNYTGSPPDWQQGFVTATIWPDGKFHLQHASFVDGTLLYGNQRINV